jgi:hypothetical protein
MSQQQSQNKTAQWLEQAFKIADGNKMIKPQRKHVIACVASMRGMLAKIKQIDGIVQDAHAKMAERARIAGQPEPPAPPRLGPL